MSWFPKPFYKGDSVKISLGGSCAFFALMEMFKDIYDIKKFDGTNFAFIERANIGCFGPKEAKASYLICKKKRANWGYIYNWVWIEWIGCYDLFYHTTTSCKIVSILLC